MLKTPRHKRSGGIEGHRATTAAAIKRHGRGFVGEAPPPEPVVLTEWDWLAAKAPWSRKKMWGYMVGWLGDCGLLKSELDQPAVCQIVEACLMIQEARVAMVNMENPERALSIGIKINSLWTAINGAMARLDLAGAVEAEANKPDLNEQALRKFEVDYDQPEGYDEPEG